MRKSRSQVLVQKPGNGSGASPLPALRQMTVIAQDPSVRAKGRKGPILMAALSIPAEDLIPGPIGYRLQLVDYDATTRRFIGAHDLPRTLAAEPRTWRDGHPRIVEDNRFHAQNVYALVMKTLARFEFALGRRVGWSFGTHQLKVAPHGMLDANAFYSLCLPKTHLRGFQVRARPSIANVHARSGPPGDTPPCTS